MKHQFSIDELRHREHLIQAQQAEEQARQVELEEHQVAGPPTCWPRSSRQVQQGSAGPALEPAW